MAECPVVPFFGAFLRELREILAPSTTTMPTAHEHQKDPGGGGGPSPSKAAAKADARRDQQQRQVVGKSGSCFRYLSKSHGPSVNDLDLLTRGADRHVIKDV